MSDLADYAWLTGEEAVPLLEDCSNSSEPVHRQLQRLRKVLSTERARLVVEQAELRRRAEGKFGLLAAKMFFTDIALQQATDWWTARYKASRHNDDTPMRDYCCGIGGDLLALAELGSVTGWDSSPEVACFAEANLRAVGSHHAAKVCVAQAEQHPPESGELWHIDPDRRHDGRRSTKMQWHSPGPDVIENFRQASSRGVLKLSPATEVPINWQEETELEWISWDRQCRQQVVWFDGLAREIGKRCATLVFKTDDMQAAPKVVSFVGNPNVRVNSVAEPRRFLYDADPALRASGLTGALAVDQELDVLGDESGYLTGDHLSHHKLLSCFEMLEQFPLRVNPLSKHLRELGIGRLEIKKRGVETDPEQLRRQLKLKGHDSGALLLTCIGNRKIAILARRCTGGVTE